MRTLAIILGLIFLAIGVVYLLVPAESLPSFFPGFEAGLTRARFKHGLASLAVGVVLLGVAWFTGRSRG